MDELTYKKDLFSRYLYGKYKPEDLKETEKSLSEKFVPSDILMEEVFEDFYKSSQQELPASELSLEGQIAKKVHTALSDLPEFQELKKLTTGNYVNSIISQKILADKLASLFPSPPEDQPPGTTEDEQSDYPGCQPGQDCKNQQLSQGLQKQSQQLTADGGSQLRNEMRKAIKQSTDQIKDLDEAESILWGNDAGEKNAVSYEERIMMSQKLQNSSRYKLITDLLGRLKSIINSVYQSDPTQASEFSDIELGDEISRLIPMELLKLHHPILHKLFLRQFSEKKLMQYKLSGKDKLGKGDIICCIDRSGSMSGQKISYAVSMAIALQSICRKEKRAMQIIFFDSGLRDIFMHVEKFKGQDLLNLCSYGTDGGTNFDLPLTKAIELLKDRSDILFITDGECEIKNLANYKKAIKDKFAKFLTISIGVDNPQLQELSTLYIRFQDILSNKNIQESEKIFKQIRKIK